MQEAENDRAALVEEQRRRQQFQAQVSRQQGRFIWVGAGLLIAGIVLGAWVGGM